MRTEVNTQVDGSEFVLLPLEVTPTCSSSCDVWASSGDRWVLVGSLSKDLDLIESEMEVKLWEKRLPHSDCLKQNLGEQCCF